MVRSPCSVLCRWLDPFDFMVPCAKGYTKTRRDKMTILANIVIAVVAVLHIGFLLLEMFFWNHPFGRKRFDMTPEYSQASASLAANQGLYNGFLAAGLI